MPDGKHCPVCGVDIGVWPVFSAGLPNLIWCPKCKARLAYQSVGRLVVVLLLLIVAVTAISGLVALQFEGVQRLAAFIAVMFGIWVPAELVFVRYLRANKVLEARSRRKHPPTTE